jgi:predicted nucleic acid-binding protein
MLIDTNIFLGVFLSQAKVNDCLNFLEKLDRGELQGFVTDFTIHGIAVVLERAGQEDFMPQVFASLSSFQGLTLLHASLLDHSEIALLAT